MAKVVHTGPRPWPRFILLSSTCLPATAQDLRWGGDAEGGAPYRLPNPKNPREIIGFEIDLMTRSATSSTAEPSSSRTSGMV